MGFFKRIFRSKKQRVKNDKEMDEKRNAFKGMLEENSKNDTKDTKEKGS